jgi:glycerol-3-phosphate dehydrogenase
MSSGIIVIFKKEILLEYVDLNNLFPMRTSDFGKDEVFDVAVVGAGVVGTAIFKEFCEQGAKTVLIEKANDILEGASKGNSAILHTGFDAPPDTLEHECVQRGYAEYMKIKDEMNLPFSNSKALVVAWNDEQLGKLDAILKKGLGNGVKELELLSSEQIIKTEPNLSKDAKGAILVHGESLIDPWSAPLAYLKKGINCGGKTAFSHEVKDGHYNGKYWELETSQKTIRAKVVINAAGLYGDIVDSIKGTKDFKIIPRKGQFVIFDETAFNLINSIILPVPTKRTKGVVITKTAFGNILVGPTAEDQESRDDSQTVKETLEDLKNKAFYMLPDLKNHKVTATFAGLRPASDETFYRVSINEDKNWITAGGIRSTGLTASLGLAKHIFELHDTKYEKNPKKDEKITVPNISEFAPRDNQKAGYGKIVCHCECVTEREIKNACHGESGAGNVGGLKRRTRAMMGRCQGFNCEAAITQICKNEVKKS